MGQGHSHYHEHGDEDGHELSHNHGHAHHLYHHHHGDSNNLRTAFLLNLGFTVVEIIGAYLTNSVAILSDALHDLGDSIALGMAWGLEKHAVKEAPARYSYGYGRLSLLAAFINAAVLIAGGLFVLAEVIPRLLNPEVTNAPGMILLALGGIAVNGAAVWRLQGGGTMNAKVAMWHLLEDVLGWVAVLIVGITLLFVDLYILDSILSLLITLYILYSVIGHLKKTAELFLQAAPEGVDLSHLDQRLRNISAVKDCHHTHLWSLDGDHHVLSTHLVVNHSADQDEIRDIKKRAREVLDGLHLTHITIEIEYPGDCSMVENRV
ncbi:MAG: cation transporter [Caldilineaceae bacterium SB0670_bin_27]|uniref:Cation transporter n=1 Tax=Caldilineaceae bacterium SB0664_bin_27 TaxID=2605260 RepID=A0A6B0YQY0_9CHLR|nr:cation transporter [Caldilineaceae bacterium SB0664_bin_27]MYJ76989.1 cation transporter [Caldilineaceae bacterium SB0670_bin_27]